MNTQELNSQLETNDLADELSDEALDRAAAVRICFVSSREPLEKSM